LTATFLQSGAGADFLRWYESLIKAWDACAKGGGDAEDAVSFKAVLLAATLSAPLLAATLASLLVVHLPILLLLLPPPTET